MKSRAGKGGAVVPPLRLITYDSNNKPSVSIRILRGAPKILSSYLYRVSKPSLAETTRTFPDNPSETITEYPKERVGPEQKEEKDLTTGLRNPA